MNEERKYTSQTAYNPDDRGHAPNYQPKVCLLDSVTDADRFAANGDIDDVVDTARQNLED